MNEIKETESIPLWRNQIFWDVAVAICVFGVIAGTLLLYSITVYGDFESGRELEQVIQPWWNIAAVVSSIIFLMWMFHGGKQSALWKWLPPFFVLRKIPELRWPMVIMIVLINFIAVSVDTFRWISTP